MSTDQSVCRGRLPSALYIHFKFLHIILVCSVNSLNVSILKTLAHAYAALSAPQPSPCSRIFNMRLMQRHGGVEGSSGTRWQRKSVSCTESTIPPTAWFGACVRRVCCRAKARPFMFMNQCTLLAYALAAVSFGLHCRSHQGLILQHRTTFPQPNTSRY